MNMRQIATTMAALTLWATSAWAGDPTTRPAIQKNLAQVIEHKNTDQDLLRIHVTYARAVDGKYVVWALARWGDLDNRIAAGGKEYYSKWDGSVHVQGGTLDLVRKPGFDDRSGREPKDGTGVDKISATSSGSVEWQSAVVGWTDGLLIKFTFESLQGAATIKAGNFTVPITPTTPPAK